MDLLQSRSPQDNKLSFKNKNTAAARAGRHEQVPDKM